MSNDDASNSLFVIYALDPPESMPIRDRYYPDHRRYLNEYRGPVAIVMTGPLIDSCQRVIGSLFIVDAHCLEEVEEFNHQDPFFTHGVWESSEITGFIRRR